MLAAGHLTAARVIARSMDPVPLPAAARLTVLIGQQEPERFEAAGRRLLARMAGETRLSLRELAEAACALEELSDEPLSEAADVVVRIAERR